MRIVFVGSVEFSDRLLVHLIHIGAEIVGVCTRRVDTKKSDYSDLSKTCNEFKIPWIYADDINSEYSKEWVKSLKPDIIFCFGWPKLLEKSFLELAPAGVLGYHPTLLPLHRGRHPLIWALALGLEQTGSTFFFMDTGPDSGDILSQEIVKIEFNDRARVLYEKLLITAMNQISVFLPQLETGKYVTVKQDEDKSSNWRKREKFDGQIDWRMSKKSIYNLVRSLSEPYPGASFFSDGTEVKIWKVEMLEGETIGQEPGKVVGVDGTFPIIQCGDGAIRLLDFEPKIEIRVGAYL
jgi:methionyl-tRNA formyltransferase